jgi:hypothetical protein
MSVVFFFVHMEQSVNNNLISKFGKTATETYKLLEIAYGD